MGKVHATKHLAFFWVVNDSTVHCVQGLKKVQSVFNVCYLNIPA